MTDRLRFAPSPTGMLHVGGARSALFNWLHARRVGGTFLLRIEDTDTERNREEWVVGLLDSMRWLGLEWDEEPVRQSQRGDLYVGAADKLTSSGLTYWCNCTAEEVQSRAKERGGPPGYDGFCRDRGLGPGDGAALRFRTPDTGATSFRDLIRGEVSFDNATLEDFVVVRSNGVPTFLLANAVDDVDQAITHVVHGEEHVNGTPKYLLLRHTLGHPEPPTFAHLPVIVNEKRQKLSKRRDDVAVETYRDNGYLPSALVNYLATLGWGPPDGVELRPVDEIVSLFRLDDVTKSSAFFDVKKLEHFNGEYIRALSVDAFVDAVSPWLGDRAQSDTFARIATAVQERVSRLDQVEAMVDFLFDEPAIDPDAWQKVMINGRDLAVAMLDGALDTYASSEWSAAVLHDVTTALAERAGAKLGKAQAPLRLAVTGRTVGPPLFESLEVLGRDETLHRLRAARERLDRGE